MAHRIPAPELHPVRESRLATIEEKPQPSFRSTLLPYPTLDGDQMLHPTSKLAPSRQSRHHAERHANPCQIDPTFSQIRSSRAMSQPRSNSFRAMANHTPNEAIVPGPLELQCDRSGIQHRQTSTRRSTRPPPPSRRAVARLPQALRRETKAKAEPSSRLRYQQRRKRNSIPKPLWAMDLGHRHVDQKHSDFQFASLESGLVKSMEHTCSRTVSTKKPFPKESLALHGESHPISPPESLPMQAPRGPRSTKNDSRLGGSRPKTPIQKILRAATCMQPSNTRAPIQETGSRQLSIPERPTGPDSMPSNPSPKTKEFCSQQVDWPDAEHDGNAHGSAGSTPLPSDRDSSRAT